MEDQVLSLQDVELQAGRVGQELTGRGSQSTSLSFARMLEQLRDERGLTKADLAKKAGVDPSTITRFEQGTRLPERATVLQLADAMVLPMVDRDTLLAAAGYRSELWDDPLFSELIQLMADGATPEQARGEVRGVIRMAISYLKLQRLQDS